MARIAAFLLLLVLLPSASHAQATQARYALVIGNQSYSSRVGSLNTPHKDAETMAAALQRLGFDVTLIKDAGRREMEVALARHAMQVRQGGRDAISFVYYAGHGAADAATRTNYLIPVDVPSADDRELWSNSVSQSDIITRLKAQAPDAVHYLVVDACRSELQLTGDASRGADRPSAQKGFAPTPGTPGVLLAFATAPGASVADSTGQETSPFTKALVEEIVKPNIEAVSMFRNVRRNVLQSVGQEPWLSAPDQPSVYLAHSVASSPAQQRLQMIEMAEAWNATKNTTNVAVLEAFANRYSGTLYSEMARARLSELEQPRVALATRPVGAEAEPRGPCPNNMCTPVSVFFGTDRKREGATRVAFGPDRAEMLQLGHAIVTVPRRTQRKLGDIPRPNWLDLNILRVPPSGDPARHFTIPVNGISVYGSPAEFLAAVRSQMGEAGEFKDHAIVFVHGYRMPFDDALYRTAQITYDLGGDGVPFGTAFLYSWPSGGELKDYKYDFDSARFAVEHLKAFLDLVVAKSGAKRVHIIAHSMGNWPLLAALQNYKKPAKGAADIHQLILAAPDIDAKEFLRMAAKIATTCKGVTLYASANDIAMKAAREIHRGAVRAGDVTGDGPVVVMKGIDTIDISVLSTDVLSAGHSEYADRKELLNDVGLLLRKGERPPHLRTPIFQRLRAKDEVYWRYPN